MQFIFSGIYNHSLMLLNLEFLTKYPYSVNGFFAMKNVFTQNLLVLNQQITGRICNYES